MAAGRGRRVWIALVIVLIVLGGLFVAADRIAAFAAERTIADQAKKELVARNITSPSDPTVAVSGWTQAFARDLAAVPAARELSAGHDRYLFEVTRTLLDFAVERGDIESIDTAAVARVLSMLGGDFAQPDVITTLESSPKEAADAVVDLIIRGLGAGKER